MEKALSIWERTQLIDPLDAVIERSKTEGNFDLLLAQIPSLFGDSDKATYLGFRSLGFRPTQCMEFLRLPMYVLDQWKIKTPELIEFEYEKLPELQKNVGADIVRLQFLRNMTLFMFQDSLTISKSMEGLDNLSIREFNYLKSIRRFYDPSSMLSLQKALEPEKHRQNTLVLSFGNTTFEVVEDEEGHAQLRSPQEVIDVNSRED